VSRKLELAINQKNFTATGCICQFDLGYRAKPSQITASFTVVKFSLSFAAFTEVLIDVYIDQKFT